MTETANFGWDRLRHGGLLLDTQRLNQVAEFRPEPLPDFIAQKLRRQVDAVLDGNLDPAAFISFVLERVCGFLLGTGNWLRGSQVGSEWTRRAVTGEAVKPRHLWQGNSGGVLPVFIDTEKRVGIGRGRKAASQTLQWLRDGNERLALLTNGRQWRLIFAGLDFDAWCEWDVDLWLEEGRLSPQVTALQTLLSPAAWSPASPEETPALLKAIQDSRKGQAELSAVLGERVREAVEILLQAHGEVLKEYCADVDSADVYRAAVRVVMRIVVALFAESRELLPQDNVSYHGAYGINGLRESLEKQSARGLGRMGRCWSAWPRIIGLFRLIHRGSHHQALPVPEYGGELFAPGDPNASDGMTKALSIFETACFERELMTDKDVFHLLERITRTRVKIRQGRASIWVPAPVDFSDLSSEYIGILYEGLLDFELKTAPANDPVIFLSVGNQPALPLSRLEAMDDKALANLLDKMKDTGGDEEAADDVLEAATDEALEDDSGAGDAQDEDDAAQDMSEDTPGDDETADCNENDEDHRRSVRIRAETWAQQAVIAGNLVPKPKGRLTPEKRLVYEGKITRKARQLVSRVVLPGEWYLVRWGGTRKGSGTFYTRPGLAVPTVQRTLKPLVYQRRTAADGHPKQAAAADAWAPEKPEKILALKLCDPACGSGTFLVAALRFLTDALYASLHHHQRIKDDGDRSVVALITGKERAEEQLCEEILPCRPDDAQFEARLKALLRRHVVEHCLYGVDLDPLAVELCRLSLWVETMDRSLPFSFLDHKIKCGNSLVGAWFDQFQHYPVMAWKNRDGGDKNHTNGVHFEKDMRTKALKQFVKDELTPDLLDLIENRVLFHAEALSKAQKVHEEALENLSLLHGLPVHESTERARIYREEVVGSEPYQALKSALDLWCACWFWPPDRLESAPLPTCFTHPEDETIEIAGRLASQKKFFHWELEFPDVFNAPGAGFDAILGNPPWDIAKPNSKEFFSNIDPLYRAYGKQEAISYQTKYFEDENTERDWLAYNADFRAQSNFFGYSSNPYGDPEENEKSQDRFSIKRGKANLVLHKRWRKARQKGSGFSDPKHPFRHQGSADINLYKLFLEQAHVLLQNAGRLGFIVPSGLYSDHGTGALRNLFINRSRWEWLFGFENREGIFEIHRSYKFNPVIIEKGGRTDAIQTAFMRRKLEDWEQGENFVTPYLREQVEKFSPRSKAILEIQSARDLEILEKIYSNSVLLGDDSPDGWGIKYATEFHMTNDSKLFPPRPKWEAQGYRPDEYSCWLKGNWQPIEELWKEMGVEPLGEGGYRCAQPPYDRLPIPRADISSGIILSREAESWIREDEIEDIALPLYEGRMIGQFDFSQKGWVSGKGRSAVWRDVKWDYKQIQPQYLLSLKKWQEEKLAAYLRNFKKDYGSLEAIAEGNRLTDPDQFVAWWSRNRKKIAFIDVTSATNTRTMFSAALAELPCGNSAPVLFCENVVLLPVVLNSIAYDTVARFRCTGVHLNWFVIDESVLPKKKVLESVLLNNMALVISFGNQRMAEFWIENAINRLNEWKRSWPITPAERLRLRCILDVVVAFHFGLSFEDFAYILGGCDSNSTEKKILNPKGFWRVDRDKHSELRQTVLTLVAFKDLEEKIRQCEGDREKGIKAFLNQNDGEGWMLPETLRLADYGLGHDERAKQPQPVASSLGPRFFDWQLSQDPEESWRECHLHARNMLGRRGYLSLLGEVLRDTEPGKWRDVLQPACDLVEKENLVRIFSSTFSSLPADVWENRMGRVPEIFREKGFSYEPEDKIGIISGALAKAPKDSRPDCLASARDILGPSGFIGALEQLLDTLTNWENDLWLELIREQIGDKEYQRLTAGRVMATQDQIAEPTAPYGKGIKRYTQKGLFD